MTTPRQIEVAGLREFQREVRRIGPEYARELRRTNKAAAELIANEARSRALSIGGVAAYVAPSLKAQAQSASASVKLGSERYPMAGGAEFGSGRNMPRQTRRGTVRGWNQFVPWTGNSSDAGRFLYPTIRSRQSDVVEMYGDALDRIARAAFPD